MKLENVFMLLPNRTIGFGSIEIEGDTIAKIDLSPAPDATHQSRLVLPGLVNCHCHAPMTLLRGVGGGLPLQRWLEEAIFPAEAKMTRKDVEAGVRWGVMEMLAGGTTAVADMYDFPDICESVLSEAGMTGFVCRVGLSFIPGRLKECIDFAAARPDRHLSVHSEYLTDEAFCRALAEANRELKRPVHLHVSETQKEHFECIKRHGATPIEYLSKTGLLDFGGYAAHCVYCTDDDFGIMRDFGVSLVHNPTSNLKLGSGIARISNALECGVNVALGTDGCASNDNLNMFEEMHLCSLIHKGVARDPLMLSPWDVIDMATVCGAKALGMMDGGELREGFRADLALIDLNRPHLQPCSDISSLVVHSMQSSDVMLTLCNGKVVYDRDAPIGGRYPSINEEKAAAEFAAAVERVAR